MDTKSTIRTAARPIVCLTTGFALFGAIVYGQAPVPQGIQPKPEVSPWRKLGNSSVGLNLAGPASGPIDAVWFSGDRLIVRTRGGQTLETADFSNWAVSRSPGAPPGETVPYVIGNIPTPEIGAKVQSIAGRLYSLGNNLQVSDDYGRTWTNLTAYNREPVIGPHQHWVAVSPDSRSLVVANDYGVWRSADGGLSWSGLNDDLPNLPIRRLLPSASPGTIRAEIEGIGQVDLPPVAAAAHASWIRASENRTPNSDQTAAQRLAAGRKLGAEITAFARTATTWFAGSIDGRLWTSSDNGETWGTPQSAAGRIETIQTGEASGDPPRSALAIVSAPGASGLAGRILRTTGGDYWEDIGLPLPEGALHGVAVDASSGVAYVAGDHGVFTAHVDMNNLMPVQQWQRVEGLPEARAMDVHLDLVRNILYVAMDGYGLYASPAPHKSAAIRVLTAADQPAKSAAPGVLLNVQGSGLSRVSSDGSDLALVTRSSSAAQVQVPFEASGPTVALTFDSTRGQSHMALPLRSAAPSILLDPDGLPLLVDAASGVNLDSRNMARAGSRIQVFAAGLGKVTPEWRAGIPAPDDPPAVAAKVEARLDGNALEVTRATLAPGYVGLYLVEVQLPGLVNAGPADFSLAVDGETSNHVRIVLSVE